MNALYIRSSCRITPLFIIFLLLNLSGCGGSSAPPAATPGGTNSVNFPAQAQNVNLVAGVPRPITTANTFDVAALGGPFQAVTIDATKALGNIFGSGLRPVLGSKTQIATGVSHSTVNITPDLPNVGNCFPFGIGPLGNPPLTGSTTGWGPYGGFIYQNVPAFELQLGEALSFDLALPNDIEIGLDIYMAPTTVDGGTANAGAFTKIVSKSQTPANPLGDSVIGNFELRFIAEYAFSFPGGGLIILFGEASPTYNGDISCTQVLVNGDPSDTSGYFVERFLRDANGISTWDEVFPDTIGAFRIGGDGPLAVGATVQVYTGLLEEEDNLCTGGAGYQLLTVYLNSLNELDAVIPGTFTASQDVVDIYNTGSIATCTVVTAMQDVADVSMSGLEADYETCTEAPGNFDGIWSGTYVCGGNCPDADSITLTVTQNGDTATYTDGFANYSGHICGNVFSFRGSTAAYDESGKLVIDDANPDAAIKSSFYKSLTGPMCSGSCTDNLTRQ